MNEVTFTSDASLTRRRTLPADTSHRALLAAAARLLTAGDRADRATFLARALNGLADVLPALGTRALDDAAHAASDYQALLEAVNSPEVTTAWQANDPLAAARRRAVELNHPEQTYAESHSRGQSRN